eukprot:2104196-Rhodomonas_salina.1
MGRIEAVVQRRRPKLCQWGPKGSRKGSRDHRTLSSIQINCLLPVWLARPCSPRLRSDWVAMEATAARLLHLQHSGESVAALRKGMNGHHPNAFSSGICTGGLL